ncbi:MAG: hypothetical protein Q9220_003706 [cf. Caloplaca sp. 1 TL-2023]
MLGDIPYYVPATPFTTVKLSAHTPSQSFNGITPVTIINVSAGNDSVEGYGSIAATFTTDDVWSPYFLEGNGYTAKQTPENITVAGSSYSSEIIALDLPSSSNTIPNGPYFLGVNGGLYQPYRLYSDFAAAFTQPLIPASGGSYAALPAALSGIQAPALAVPSRLYYTRTASKPLAGVRIGIKDIYDVAGVKTSDGNRAFYGLYPPRTVNSVPVQRLVDAGAIIVGKMKTSQFANGELATADWVDYHAPFNPRGDGYQDPSSSSAGAGAGTASYPWLDISLGSDTGGSIRGPAQVQGIIGNRPTHGAVELTGVMPLAPELDTAGFLVRDPSILKAASIALYPNLTFYSNYPKTITTLDFPTPNATDESTTAILSFLANLTSFLGGAKTIPANLETSWSSSKPNPALPPLAQFLNTTYPTLITKEQTKNVRDPFFRDYAAAHDGRRPFVDPVPTTRWAYGDSLPASALTEAINNKTIFMDWFTSHFVLEDPTTCSDSLLLYFEGRDNFQARNQYKDPPRPPFGFGNGQISIFAEVPDFVVPVGQAAYNSSITGHVEVLPVTVDLIAARGCDGMLINLIQDLTAAGILQDSQTGQTIKGGEILLKRGMLGL